MTLPSKNDKIKELRNWFCFVFLGEFDLATKKKTASKKNTASRRTSSGKKKATAAGRSAVAKRRKQTAAAASLRDFCVLAALAFSVLLFLADFNLLGALGPILKSVNMGIFGCMGYAMPVLLFFGICFLISNDGQFHAWVRIFGAFLLLTSVCGFFELFGGPEFDPGRILTDYYLESADGSGGGILGGTSVFLFMPSFGGIGTAVLLLVIAVLGFGFLAEWSFTSFIREETHRVQDSRGEDRKRREELATARLEEREARRERNHEEKLLRSRQKTEQLRTQAHQARTQHPAVPAEKEETKPVDFSEKKEQHPGKETSFSSAGRADSFHGNIFFGNDLYREEPPVSESDRNVSPAQETQSEENSPGSAFASQRSSGNFAPVTWQKAQHAANTAPPAPEPDRSLSDFQTDPAPFIEDISSAADPTLFAEDISWEEPEIQPQKAPQPEAADTYETYEDVFPEADIPAAKNKEEDSGRKTVVTSSGKVITVELDGIPGSRKAEPPAPDEKTDLPKTIEYKEPKEYRFPSYQLLKKESGKASRTAMDRELRETAIKLQQTLQNFGVGVTVTNVSCGPAVTRYELQPEQGVKVSRITSLTDDIKLNLAAADIRIEAPIPGKSVIGIEVPNRENATVCLRDLLESEEFRSHRSRLAFAVGKDIGGQNIIGDIAKMPHLLIAGATGSGKSVCINTLIMSLLYKSKPSEVKLIMIDPKVVELSVYNGIPHLLIPVVTDPKKAAGALNWAVAEMNSRYNKFAEYNVREMTVYNQRIDALTDIPEEERPEKMSHIVIIVDELADLMMVAPGDVEDAICRLAQMARAAGIHLVIATQRPSVNVITGLIKANIPSRIAFAVSSGVDSRTIIDMNGAEKLLGKGDMLYYPQGLQKPIRVQGAFVSDSEVSAVVEALSSQGEVIGSGQNEKVLEAASSQASKSSVERDELFLQAGRFIIEKDKASIGNLQRMFKIGFNRAARIMDQLAQAGVVGEEEGTKPRRILMTREEFDAWAEESF